MLPRKANSADVLPDDPAVNANNSSEVETQSPAKVTLLHLMWWITITAIMLAAWRQIIAGQDDQTDAAEYRIIQTLFSVFGSVVFGAVAVSLATLMLRWRKGFQVFQHPGHWVLLLEGGLSCSLMLLTVSFEFYVLFVEFSPANTQYYFHGTLLMSICFLGGLVYWLRWIKPPPAWRYLAWVLIVTTLLESIRICGYIFLSSGLPGEMWQQELAIITLLASGLIVAVLGDRNAPRRDWLHNAGLAIVLWNLVNRLVWAVLNFGY